jgi:hypothetical protein
VYNLPNYTVHGDPDRDYVEVLFDTEVDPDDEEVATAAEEEFNCNGTHELDWRDGQTLWLWEA